MRKVNIGFGITFLAIVAVLFIGVFIGAARTHGDYERGKYSVFSEGSPTPWICRGLKDAEKQAHWLIYGLDCKIALIVDERGQLVDRVQKDDGKNVSVDG